MSEPIMIFSTQSYHYLRDELVTKNSRFRPGHIDFTSFPDGEYEMRVRTEVMDRPVVVVGSTVDDTSLLELLDLCDALTINGARSLRIYVPYFGFARQNRRLKVGSFSAARRRAARFGSLIQPPHGLRLMVLDPHCGELPDFFPDSIISIPAGSAQFWNRELPKLLEEWGVEEFQFGSVDLGRSYSIQKLGDEMNVPKALLAKRRIDGSTTEVLDLYGEVSRKNVVIFDDMIATGGSAMAAASRYRDEGAERIYLVATHGVLPGEALQSLEQSGLFAGVVTTDSHDRAKQLDRDRNGVEGERFFKVISCVSPFHQWLSRSLSLGAAAM